MRTLEYNNSAHTLRLEFPSEWDIASITAVNITIKDDNATDLLAQTSATLYSATTLNGAVSSGANTITVANDAGNLAEGDRVRLANPSEDVTVRDYNASTKVATLESTLLYDHADGSAVSPCWCTYDLDTSTVATWVLNLECTIIWEPDLDGKAKVEWGLVRNREFAVSDFSNRFRLLYPASADVISMNLDEYLAESQRHCTQRMRWKGIDPDKVIDTESLEPIYLAYAHWQIQASGGDTMAHERAAAWEDYVRLETDLLNSPLWVDADQGYDEDDSEVDTHIPAHIRRQF